MNTSRPLRPAPIVVTILATIAFMVGSYLLWHSIQSGSQLAGCSGEGAGCNEVLETRWSEWFGIPVSAGGLLVYAAILGFSLLMRKGASARQWWILLALSVAAAGSALWFISLQLFIVKSYCWYCMTVHACGLLTFTFVLKNCPTERMIEAKKNKKKREEGLPSKQKAAAMAAGLSVIAVLAAGQIIGPRIQPPPPVAPPVASRQPQTSVQTAPQQGREVNLINGALRFQMGQFPIFGSPDASRVVAHFFDFTCPACRDFHPALMAADVPNETTTALVMIPIPLDAKCNPGIRETAYAHRDACDYAKIALAIWNTRPDQYNLYDTFLFQGEYPPPLDAARGYAQQLIGADTLTAALGDPHIEEQLRAGLQMFYSSAIPNKGLPALATPDSILVGGQSPSLLNSILSGRQ